MDYNKLVQVNQDYHKRISLLEEQVRLLKHQNRIFLSFMQNTEQQLMNFRQFQQQQQTPQHTPYSSAMHAPSYGSNPSSNHPSSSSSHPTIPPAHDRRTSSNDTQRVAARDGRERVERVNSNSSNNYYSSSSAPSPDMPTYITQAEDEDIRKQRIASAKRKEMERISKLKEKMVQRSLPPESERGVYQPQQYAVGESSQLSRPSIQRAHSASVNNSNTQNQYGNNSSSNSSGSNNSNAYGYAQSNTSSSSHPQDSHSHPHSRGSSLTSTSNTTNNNSRASLGSANNKNTNANAHNSTPSWNGSIPNARNDSGSYNNTNLANNNNNNNLNMIHPASANSNYVAAGVPAGADEEQETFPCPDVCHTHERVNHFYALHTRSSTSSPLSYMYI